MSAKAAVGCGANSDFMCKASLRQPGTNRASYRPRERFVVDDGPIENLISNCSVIFCVEKEQCLHCGMLSRKADQRITIPGGAVAAHSKRPELGNHDRFF